MSAPDPAIGRVLDSFANAFGGAPDLVARAPGRVNLIGEHTDYNDGFVLPVAISARTLVAARATPERVIDAAAADFADARSRFALDAPIAADRDQPWADYVRGMVAAMAAGGHAVSGAQLAITGSVPKGSGLSSSASLAVAVGTALSALGGFGLDGEAVARLAQAAECDFVGMRCGIMDQLASAKGEAGHALLIDCRSLACRPVPLPGDAAVLIVHSGIVRGLVEGHYNERRAQCEAAARALGVWALRDAEPAMLEAASARIDPVALRRARHVIGENARVLAAADALARGDLAALGTLMAASHASMRDDFSITLPAIDALAAELQALIGGAGGARMTGGGFGGAVVAVLPRARVPDVLAALSYRTPAGTRPIASVEVASAGAGLV